MISGVFVSLNESSTYPPTRVREVQSPLIQTRQEPSGRDLCSLVQTSAVWSYSEPSDTLQKDY